LALDANPGNTVFYFFLNPSVGCGMIREDLGRNPQLGLIPFCDFTQGSSLIATLAGGRSPVGAGEEAGGFSACSRWLSKVRATPPDHRPSTIASRRDASNVMPPAWETRGLLSF